MLRKLLISLLALAMLSGCGAPHEAKVKPNRPKLPKDAMTSAEFANITKGEPYAVLVKMYPHMSEIGKTKPSHEKNIDDDSVTFQAADGSGIYWFEFDLNPDSPSLNLLFAKRYYAYGNRDGR